MIFPTWTVIVAQFSSTNSILISLLNLDINRTSSFNCTLNLRNSIRSSLYNICVMLFLCRIMQRFAFVLFSISEGGAMARQKRIFLVIPGDTQVLLSILFLSYSVSTYKSFLYFSTFFLSKGGILPFLSGSRVALCPVEL